MRSVSNVVIAAIVGLNAYWSGNSSLSNCLLKGCYISLTNHWREKVLIMNFQAGGIRWMLQRLEDSLRVFWHKSSRAHLPLRQNLV